MITAHQLRGLIRNDEALVEHYVQWLASLEPGDLAPVPLAERISQTMQRLKARRIALAELLSPAASTDETLAGSLVTKNRAQPETTLHV